MIDLIVGRKYKLKTLREIEELDIKNNGPGLNNTMEDIIEVGIVTIRKVYANEFYVEEDGGSCHWIHPWVDCACSSVELPEDLFVL